MNDIEFITKETEYLFQCNFFDEAYDPEDNPEHLDRAEALLEKYPWRTIFDVWKNYLINKCSDAKSVINFCNLYSYYGGTDEPIINPYEFLGYIYYKVDIDNNWDEYGDFLDGFCVSILQECGCISLTTDPSYRSWEDPLIIAEVNKLKRIPN